MDEPTPLSDNERRARTGGDAVWCAASQSAAAAHEPAQRAVTEALRDIAHFCDQLGVRAYDVFNAALSEHRDDVGAGGRVRRAVRPDVPLAAQIADLDAA
ncbi:MAG TPA: hypothetical protein VGO80_06465 [Solirubrobacteraceae bacterium]|nr:hypothetical protein [Solirubrobacteraceae bacterium]